MEPVYYMEYSESFKIVNEMYTALYKYRNSKAWGPFKIQDIKTRAYEGAKKRWAELKKISRKERLVKVSFYEESFTCVTGDVTQEFSYGEIQCICETDTTLALVADKKRKKEGTEREDDLDEEEKEEAKDHLLRRKSQAIRSQKSDSGQLHPEGLPCPLEEQREKKEEERKRKKESEDDTDRIGENGRPCRLKIVLVLLEIASCDEEGFLVEIVVFLIAVVIEEDSLSVFKHLLSVQGTGFFLILLINQRISFWKEGLHLIERSKTLVQKEGLLVQIQVFFLKRVCQKNGIPLFLDIEPGIQSELFPRLLRIPNEREGGEKRKSPKKQEEEQGKAAEGIEKQGRESPGALGSFVIELLDLTFLFHLPPRRKRQAVCHQPPQALCGRLPAFRPETRKDV